MNPYPANQSILVMDNCQIHHNIELVDIVNAVGMLPCLKFYILGDDSFSRLSSHLSSTIFTWHEPNWIIIQYMYAYLFL